MSPLVLSGSSCSTGAGRTDGVPQGSPDAASHSLEELGLRT